MLSGSYNPLIEGRTIDTDIDAGMPLVPLRHVPALSWFPHSQSGGPIKMVTIYDSWASHGLELWSAPMAKSNRYTTAGALLRFFQPHREMIRDMRAGHRMVMLSRVPQELPWLNDIANRKTIRSWYADYHMPYANVINRIYLTGPSVRRWLGSQTHPNRVKVAS